MRGKTAETINSGPLLATAVSSGAVLPPAHPVPAWRPLVSLNVAVSLDGRIAGRGGRTLVLSDAEDKARVHRMRAEHDAILVGIGTVLADDPALQVRQELVPGGRDPVRVVLDSKHRTPVTARVASGEPPTILYSAEPHIDRTHVVVSRHGVDVVACPIDKTGRVDLKTALADLKRRGMDSLMVEGGARVIASFLRAGFVDRVSLFVAPVLVGTKAPPLLEASSTEDGSFLVGFDVAASEARETGVTLHLQPRHAPQ